MTLKPLHDHLIVNLKQELPDWRFSSKDRHFKKSHNGNLLYIHLSFINHVDDFDLVVNVGVIFIHNKERACVIGAELGNIEGIGQFRHSINTNKSAERAAQNVKKHLLKIGFPFLEHYSNEGTVLATLKAGKTEASLISPFSNLHAAQIQALEAIVNAG